VIGGLFEEFLRRVEMGEQPNEIMDSLGLDRYCCRRMFLTHVELIDEIAAY